MNSSRVLVSGASGPIGAALLPSLKALGYSVTRLVRGAATGPDQVAWNPTQPLSPDSVSGFDAVIHLAGESIVGRWTEASGDEVLAAYRARDALCGRRVSWDGGEGVAEEIDEQGHLVVETSGGERVSLGAGEVLASRTVKDLVVGSGLVFEDRGAATLRGVPDEWQLYAVSGG